MVLHEHVDEVKIRLVSEQVVKHKLSTATSIPDVNWKWIFPAVDEFCNLLNIKPNNTDVLIEWYHYVDDLIQKKCNYNI